ncbi:MAG: response regulator [Bacteroidota bacterium]
MTRIKILLADDDFEDRYIIADAFTEIGYNDAVHMVTNGEEVFAYLQAINDPADLPSLIVLDLNMPRMTGTEILANLKSNDLYRSIRVIIFSTSVNEKEKKQCMALGALAYITKPVKYQDSLVIARQFQEYSAMEKDNGLSLSSDV